MKRKEIIFSKGKVTLSRDIYSVLIVKICEKKGLCFTFIIFELYLIITNFLLYVLYISIWNASLMDNQDNIDGIYILVVQFMSIFILFVNLTDDIILFTKTKAIVHLKGTGKIRQAISIILLGLQLFVSVFSSYLCFINIGKRNNTIEIFKDVLAFSSISNLDNMFASLITGKQIELTIKHSDTFMVAIEQNEEILRKRLSFIYVFIIIIIFFLYRYTYVLEAISNV